MGAAHQGNILGAGRFVKSFIRVFTIRKIVLPNRLAILMVGIINNKLKLLAVCNFLFNPAALMFLSTKNSKNGEKLSNT